MKVNRLINALLVFLILIICVGVASASEDISADDTSISIDSEPLIDQGSLLNRIDDTKISNSNSIQENSNENSSLDDELISISSEKSKNTLKDDSAANVWYVKSGATGGDGSEASPYGNLKAVTSNSNYKENDIIMVMDGEYKGSNNRNIALKENTSVIAYDGANPVFDAATIASIFNIDKDGILLKGLTLRNGGGSNVNKDGISGWAGGAIYNNGTNLVIENCTIEYGDFLSYGSGIFSAGDNTVIKNCTFRGNDGLRGGAVCIYGKDAQILNNTFIENQALFGGAIYVAPNLDAQGAIIANNVFSKNRANQGSAKSVQAGGSIYMGSVLSTIANNTFSDGRSGDYGAAIAVTGDYNLIDNCSFKRNVIFDANSNANIGGAIYIQGDHVTVRNSNFTDNSVRDNGGAVFVRASYAKFENCSFDGNWAARGGAIYIQKSNSRGNITNPVINNCNFTANGVNESKGGAIYSWGENTTVTNSNFKDNIALQGGAILYENGHNFLENNTFTGNNATRYGGGAITSARFGDTINNCTFKDNNAKGYGGAVSLDFPTITNSTFINNDANHGGAISTITANVSGCEFYDNTAADGNIVLAATELEESDNIKEGQNFKAMDHRTYLDVDYDDEALIAIMDGYYAYCAEEYADYPQFGVLWENLEFMQNSESEIRVGEYLKILVYKFWIDEQGHNTLQKEINIFTDHDFRSSDNPQVQEVIRLYDSGFRVPTENAIRVLENGTIEVFNFKEVLTPSSTQNLFAFNITYNPNATVEKEIITPDPYIKGNSIEFNITVKNTGESDLFRLFINDTDFSEGLVYDNFTSDYDWTYDNESKLWYLEKLAFGESANIVLKFNITESGNLTNNVSTGIANLTFDNDTVNLTSCAPNMTVVKKSNNLTVYVGNVTEFTILVNNTGDCSLSNITIKENVPDGLIYKNFRDDTKKWWYNDGTFKYLEDLAPGESTQFVVLFDTFKSGNFTNIVTASSNLTNETNATNNTTVYTPNMTVEKIANDEVTYLGNITSFTIIVTNTGDCDLTGIVVSDDDFSEGLEFNGRFESVEGSWTYNDDQTWSLDSLAPGKNASFIVYFTVVDNGTLVNNVSAKSDLTNETNSSNKTKAYRPNMTVEKIANDEIVYLGNTTSFTIVVTNTGDCELTNVVVSDDDFSEGLEFNGRFESVEGSWTYNDDQTWSLDSLAPGKSASFIVYFTVVDNGTLVNNVSAKSDLTNETNSSNKTKAYRPNMTVEKIANDEIVYLGNVTSFTIVVTNTGDCELTGIVVTDGDFSSGLVFKDYANGTAKWDKDGDKYALVGVLAPGDSASFTVVFDVVNNGTLVNNVSAKSDLTNETNSSNKTTAYRPNMTVEKISNDPVVYIGNLSTFTIVVTNTGDCSLGEIIVKENVPDGLVYKDIQDDTNKWEYVDGIFKYLGDLAPGESTQFVVLFDTVKSGNFTNLVTASSNLTNETNSSNNTTVYTPKMTIEKIANNETVKVGENLSFTIIVRNIGDCDLTGVYIRDDEYSDGLEYVGFNDESGKWTFKSDGLWEYDGALASGENASLEIIFKAISDGEKVNTAFASSNITNETVNSTNVTNVTNVTKPSNETNETIPEDNKTENDTDNHTNKTVPKKDILISKNVGLATGNPLLVLLIASFVLVFSPFRRKK